MISQKIHTILTDDDVKTDAPEAGRFMRHLWALMATKVADGLLDPKLVLAWIMSAIGAPGYLVGLLVPVREAGALLPQILLAREIQARTIRKYFWGVGSLLQGLSALGISVAAYTLQGAQAGWVIIGCLAVLSVARASCSASYKDILARTVSAGSRGTVSGAAGTIAAAAVFGFAALLAFGIVPLTVTALSAAVALAGGLWVFGALVFLGLDEPADTRDSNAMDTMSRMLAPLWTDGQLRLFILVRGLLTATALAPPFLVILSHVESDAGLGNLGLLMLASSLAAITSSYVWGRISDTSSRKTLIYAGSLAALALGGAAIVGLVTGGLGGIWIAPAFLFGAQIAYEGVRAGRKTHLTDMKTGGQKAVYTALSNTAIGVLLLVGGVFGVIANTFGPAIVLALFAVMCLAAALCALRLTDVQSDN